MSNAPPLCGALSFAGTQPKISELLYSSSFIFKLILGTAGL